MELKDLFLAPIYLTIIYLLAFAIRGKVTSPATRKYFIPGLSLKLLGAITLGIVYQFYYAGGDTTHYFNYGKILLDVLIKDPSILFEVYTSNKISDPNIASKLSIIPWLHSPSEFSVVKFTALFNLFSFSTYSVSALFFACFCFSGMWALYRTLLKIFPNMVAPFAWSIFFIPSVFFWGSGLLKDTLCLGALGWLFYSFYSIFIEKRRMIVSAVIFVLAFIILNTIKKYILLAFLPAIGFWILMEYNHRIKSKLIRILSYPILFSVAILLAYYLAINVTKGDASYDVNKIATRTKINADYLYQVSLQQQGSAYSIGELDGTVKGMIELAPRAINVSLFRPYLWEVKNPLMLLSAFESLFFLSLAIYILLKAGVVKSLAKIFSTPLLTFSFIFSIVFAFAVGISSYNFGTLVRYKIPLIPFFSILLFYMYYFAKHGYKVEKHTIK